MAMNRTNFHIDGNDSIAEIKKRFSSVCPNCDIDFFTNDDKPYLRNACAMFSPQVRIKDINHHFQDGSIEINDQMKIEEIEGLIHNHFQLHAQVTPVTPGGQHPLTFLMQYPLREKNYDRTVSPGRAQLLMFNNVPFGA
jgi:hypothetical protein